MPKHKPVRSATESTLSCSIPLRLKNSIFGRAKLLDRTTSQLVRTALEFHERTRWQHVTANDMPIAVLSPKAEARLKEWLDSGEPLDKL